MENLNNLLKIIQLLSVRAWTQTQKVSLQNLAFSHRPFKLNCLKQNLTFSTINLLELMGSLVPKTSHDFSHLFPWATTWSSESGYPSHSPRHIMTAFPSKHIIPQIGFSFLL